MSSVHILQVIVCENTIRNQMSHLLGPAFLAWFRMGNLRGWPPRRNQQKIGLTQHWFRKQLVMTFKIISKCIEYGINVILPGFSGHIPSQFIKYRNDKKYYDGKKWFGMPSDFTNVKFLDATNDFYVELGLQYQSIQFDMLSSFLQINQTLFLWLDQFNELTPKSSNASYLTKSGQNQLKSLHFYKYFASAKQIKWTIQGWMFVHMRNFWTNDRIKSYLQSIKSDDILILDLIAEKQSVAKQSNAFFGHDYVWCFLHNFGGGHGLSGNLKNIFDKLLQHQTNNDMNWKGIGVSMEGINQNYILYDAVLSHSFDIDSTSEHKMESFIEKYVKSRYGKQIYDEKNNKILQIWHDLISIFYTSSNAKWSVTRSLITKRPRNRMISCDADLTEFVFSDNVFRVILSTQNQKKSADGFQTSLIEYTVCKEYAIWTDLLLFVRSLSMNAICSMHTLANDVAEITRQFLSDLFQQIYCLISNNEKENERLQPIMLQIIDDSDKILSDFEYFRLDFWINSARKYGLDEEERDYMELNARNLITRWGPNGEINDYSAREWNGLLTNYYKKRWKIYFDGGDVNEFEKQWQYETIDQLIDVNPNNYAKNGDFKQFYVYIFEMYEKYKALMTLIPSNTPTNNCLNPI